MTSINNLWLLLCSILVFVMQAGFLCLESGLTRSKNSISVAFNKIMGFMCCIVIYCLIGYGLIFGKSLQGLIGIPFFDFFQSKENFNGATHFLFYMAFFCTATTIVSGAIAERVKLKTYLLIVVMTSLIIYPFIAHWIWKSESILLSPSGWLKANGFFDFAGASVVHSVGGWVSLAAVLILGSRKGRFGRTNMLSSSNLPMTMLGVLFLLFGWLGFNGGALGRFDETTSTILVKTLLSGASGILSCYLLTLIRKTTPTIEELSVALLSGLVAITASCNVVSLQEAALIGGIAGLLSRGAIALLIRYHIDDAVYVIPTHLVSGIWGTLSVAFFGDFSMVNSGLASLSHGERFLIQLTGVFSVGAWAFGLSYIILFIWNRFFPLRISEEEEFQGLNYSEHKATTELDDLLENMQNHAQSQQFEIPVDEEPFTVVGQIAKQYNRVLRAFHESQFNEKLLRQQAEQRNRELMEIKKTLQKTNSNLEHEVQLRTNELIKSEKLAFLGRHSAEIVHNLQNPLAGILLCISKMEKEGSESKYLQIITGAAKQLKQIVATLLSATKTWDKSLCPVNLNEVIRSELTLLDIDRSSSKSVELDIHLEDALIIQGIPIHFHQIFGNLISNSLEAMRKSSKKILTIKSMIQKDQIKIVVADTGCGIPDELREKIFEPLFSTKKNDSSTEEGHGTGLGLSFCYNMIKSYGGQIFVYSEIDKGSSFEICLPIQMGIQAGLSQ